MINLLPDNHKKSIRAARANVLLVRYILITLVAIFILSGLLGGSYFALSNTKVNAESKVRENSQKVVSYQDVRAQADAFRTDLATAKAVYASKSSYAKLVYRIAAIVPAGVVLDSLTLDEKSFGSSATMNASAKNFDDATKLKEAFIANNEIFSNVQFQRLQYASSDSASSSNAYPVKVNLTVVINKGALK